MNNDGDIQFLEDQLQKNPDSLLFARLADSYLKSEQVDRATELCEDGTKKHPYYVTGHLILGKCYLAKKQYDQAEKEFKRVLLFDQKYLSAHKLYGDLMQEIGWENTCENSYKKILQIDPLNDAIRTSLGEVTDQVDQPETTAAEMPSGESSQDDLEAVAPLPLSSDEEEMLFEGEDPEPEDQSAALETSEPEKEAVDTEKFSSILDDIFKDEVVQEEEGPSTGSMDIYSSEEDLVSDIQREPEQYFENVDPLGEKIQPTVQPETKNEIGALNKPVSEGGFQQEATKIESTPQPEEKHEPPPESPKSTKPEKDKIVTPTLGEIYAAQGQYAKAINVFELLLSKSPDDQDFAGKIEQLKEKLAEAGNEPKT